MLLNPGTGCQAVPFHHWVPSGESGCAASTWIAPGWIEAD
jgi:hypothetical protein